MSVRPITAVGDPVLRDRAPEMTVEELRTPEIQALIDDLIETRRAAGGAGLAAPQVSALKRIAVAEVDEHTRYTYKPFIPLTVIVNPVIEPLGEEMLTINEGCLSIPGIRADVERHLTVRLHYLDRTGVHHALDADGLTAGTFQHEVDHLNGILFLDRVTDPRSFATWDQFTRHHEQAFLARVAPYTRR